MNTHQVVPFVANYIVLRLIRAELYCLPKLQVAVILRRPLMLVHGFPGDQRSVNMASVYHCTE